MDLIFACLFSVRGFVTGSTDTSLWTVYSKGLRNYCGNVLPDGMLANNYPGWISFVLSSEWALWCRYGKESEAICKYPHTDN